MNVRCEDGVDTVRRYINEPNVLIYADPPYFVKGSSLYLNSFRDAQHRFLAACLNQARQGNWVLTYDDVPQVAEYYSTRRRMNFSLNYSVHSAKSATEVMVFSDGLVAPQSEYDWA